MFLRDYLICKSELDAIYHAYWKKIKNKSKFGHV